jgi:hypothetical protein
LNPPARVRFRLKDGIDLHHTVAYMGLS